MCGLYLWLPGLLVGGVLVWFGFKVCGGICLVVVGCCIVCGFVGDCLLVSLLLSDFSCCLVGLVCGSFLFTLVCGGLLPW